MKDSRTGPYTITRRCLAEQTTSVFELPGDRLGFVLHILPGGHPHVQMRYVSEDGPFDPTRFETYLDEIMAACEDTRKRMRRGWRPGESE